MGMHILLSRLELYINKVQAKIGLKTSTSINKTEVMSTTMTTSDR